MNLFDLCIFWGASLVAIIATVMVILGRNPFHAVLYLIVSLFGVSMIFYTLGAPFLAALEIIVYAGAIMVLFLFVVQMLSPAGSPDTMPDLRRPTLTQVAFPGLLALFLLVIVLMALMRAVGMENTDTINRVSAAELGRVLFNKHYLGVELASLVLLIGIVGGMHLGRAAGNDDDETEAENALR